MDSTGLLRRAETDQLQQLLVRLPDAFSGPRLRLVPRLRVVLGHLSAYMAHHCFCDAQGNVRLSRGSDERVAQAVAASL